MFGDWTYIPFRAAGPTTPDVYDVIPLPTQDLPRAAPTTAPPRSSRPCGVGTTDTVYDVSKVSAAPAPTPAATTRRVRRSIGNTNSNTLDYIPTPSIVSDGADRRGRDASRLPPTSAQPPRAPQLTAITVSGNQATFFSSRAGHLPGRRSGRLRRSRQFSYVPRPPRRRSPRRSRVPDGDRVPPSGGATSITRDLSGHHPGRPPACASSTPGTATGTSSSVHRGRSSLFPARLPRAPTSDPARPSVPHLTIIPSTPQSTIFPTSAGGTVNAAFATPDGAGAAAIGATSQPSGAGALTLPSVTSCNGTDHDPAPRPTRARRAAPCTRSRSRRTGALESPRDRTRSPSPCPPRRAGERDRCERSPGSPAANQKGDRATTGPGRTARRSPPVMCGRSAIASGNGCVANGTTGTTYLLTGADVGHTFRVQETAVNATGDQGVAVLFRADRPRGAPRPARGAGELSRLRPSRARRRRGRPLPSARFVAPTPRLGFATSGSAASVSLTPSFNLIGVRVDLAYTLTSADVGSTIRRSSRAVPRRTNGSRRDLAAGGPLPDADGPTSHRRGQLGPVAAQPSPFSHPRGTGFQCSARCEGRAWLDSVAQLLRVQLAEGATASPHVGQLTCSLSAPSALGGTGAAVTYSFTIFAHHARPAPTAVPSIGATAAGRAR